MRFKGFFNLAFIVLLSQNVLAMSVISRDGKVWIQDAISVSGEKPDIRLIERSSNGRMLEIPLEKAIDVRVEVRYQDLIIHNASGNGRYHSLKIESEQGNQRQSIQVSIENSYSSTHTANNRVNIDKRLSVQSLYPPPPPLPRVTYPKQTPNLGRSEGRLMLVNRLIENQDFSGQSMVGSKLTNTSFDQVAMRGADLMDSKMVNIHFNRCDLRDANLTGTKLMNVRFRSSDLRTANFRHVKMMNVEFGHSNLSGAVWIDGQKCRPGSIGRCLY